MSKSFGRILLLLLFVHSAAFAQKKVALQLNLKKGDVFPLEEVNEQVITQTIMNMEQRVQQNFTTGYSFNITDVNAAGNYLADVEYLYIAVDNSVMGQSIAWDSRTGEEPDQNTLAFKAIPGTVINMEFTPEGKVLYVKGMDKMIDNMLKQYENLGEAQKEQVRANLGQTFNNEFMQATMERMLSVYPDEKVGEGDTWTRNQQLKAGYLDMAVDVNFEVTEVSKKEVVMNITSEMASNPEKLIETMGMGMPMSMKMDMKGNTSGKSAIDRKTGWIISNQTTQDFSGQVTLVEGPDMLKGQSWPMEITSSYSVKRIEL